VFTRVVRTIVTIGLVSLATDVAAAQVAEGEQLSTDDEVARGLFQAGRAAYEAGRYQEALGFFEQAHARSGRAELLFNVGQTADRLRQDEKALAAFRAFLEQRPDASNRPEVESRIAALERAEAAREDAEGSGTVTPPEMRNAPTPAQAAARTREAHASQGDAALTQADEGPAVTERWWFWTGVGAVVVGGAALALVMATNGEPGRMSPYQGNGGSLRGP
jgi:tetratricopeptide (TPR) repeat protein